MSGGSYDYLCFELANGLDNDNIPISALEAMLARLQRDYPGCKATIDTNTVLDSLKKVKWLVNELHSVWHAVEWADSHDVAETNVKQALERYQNG